jgi:PIN domain nuclease of toxin-antitoxin system
VSDVVLDASAVLAILQQETGSDRWADSLEAAALSAVNLSEVVAKLLELGMPADKALAAVAALGLEVVAFDREQAIVAAQLREPTKHLGLSLGDRACLALAQATHSPVLTADRLWDKLNFGIKILIMR